MPRDSQWQLPSHDSHTPYVTLIFSIAKVYSNLMCDKLHLKFCKSILGVHNRLVHVHVYVLLMNLNSRIPSILVIRILMELYKEERLFPNIDLDSQYV